MRKFYIIFTLLISSSFILNAATFRISNNHYVPDWVKQPHNDIRALEIGREMYINNFEILIHNVPMHIARNNADLMQYLRDIYAYDDSTITIVKRMVLILNNDEHDFRDHQDTLVLIIVGTLKDRYRK